MRLGIPKPPYTEEVAAKIGKWLNGRSFETPEIFEAFHIHPKLASRAGVLGAGFLGHGLLSVRDRELVIDRVTGLFGGEHEWGLHVNSYAEAAGLTDEQVASTCTPNLSEAQDVWPEDEYQLLQVVDELSKTTKLSDASFGVLRDRYTDPQIVEFILLVGWYRTVSSMCNVLEIAPHPDCPRFS